VTARRIGQDPARVNEGAAACPREHGHGFEAATFLQDVKTA
jgi:hypothetical protein